MAGAIELATSFPLSDAVRRPDRAVATPRLDEVPL